MKIISNDKLIQRNRKIGQIITATSLLILAAGLIISFTRPEMIMVSWGALLIGFLISQIGIYFGNRWGRSPRPDELITSNLKGLDDRFSLYHYSAPVAHLLVAPNSLWVIVPYAQKGRISYNGKRYKHTGVNFLLKLFGQEGIGRPDMEAVSQVSDLNKALRKLFPDGELPPVNAAVVFTNDDIALDVDDAPVTTITVKKLKEVVRKRVKETPIPPEQLELIRAGLE